MQSARRLSYFLVGLFFALTPMVLPISWVNASIASCSISSVSPTSFAANSSQQLVFTVQNNGSSAARWVRFTSNTANQTIDSGSSGSWGYQTPDSSTVIFVSGLLEPSDSTSFNVNVNSGSDQASSTWTVSMSDDSDGNDPTTCSGSPSISVSGYGAPTISNVSVSDVSTTSVTISYTTDFATTSTLEYGPDDGYGSTLTDDNASTSHSHVITGLTGNTTYHYTITASTTGGSNQTDDTTFTTALSVLATSTPGPTSTPIIQNTTNTVTLPTPTPTPDKKSPIVTLEQPPDQQFKDVPTIKGNAVDNDQVSVVEYTVDGGKIWNRIKSVSGLNTSNATFSFTPEPIQQGKNAILVRAKDASGNIGTSSPVSIQIDQTPPLITITTNLSKPFVKAPEIVGTAADVSGESSAEYSLDSGASWLPVDQTIAKSPTTTEFHFTPPLIDDGTQH